MSVRTKLQVAVAFLLWPATTVTQAAPRDYAIPFMLDGTGIGLVAADTPTESRVLVSEGVAHADFVDAYLYSTGEFADSRLSAVRPHSVLFFEGSAWKRASLRDGLEPVIEEVTEPTGDIICGKAVIQRDLSDPLSGILILDQRYYFEDPDACYSAQRPDTQSILAVDMFGTPPSNSVVLAKQVFQSTDLDLHSVLALHSRQGQLTAVFLTIGQELRRYTPDFASFDVVSTKATYFGRLASLRDGGVIVALNDRLRQIGVNGNLRPAFRRLPPGYYWWTARVEGSVVYWAEIALDESASIKTRIFSFDLDGGGEPRLLLELPLYGDLRGITGSRLVYSTWTGSFPFTGRQVLWSMPKSGLGAGEESTILLKASAEESFAVNAVVGDRVFLSVRARDLSSVHATIVTDTGTVVSRFGAGSGWVGWAFRDAFPYPVVRFDPTLLVLGRRAVSSVGSYQLVGPLLETVDPVTLERKRIADIADNVTFHAFTFSAGADSGYGSVVLNLCESDGSADKLCLLDANRQQLFRVPLPDGYSSAEPIDTFSYLSP